MCCGALLRGRSCRNAWRAVRVDHRGRRACFAPLQAPRTPQLTRRPDVRRHHACAPPALACDGRRASCARSAFVIWVERSAKYGRAQLSSSNFHVRATSNDAEFQHAHRVLAAQIGLCNGFLAYIFSLCHCSELNFVLKHPIEHIWSL